MKLATIGMNLQAVEAFLADMSDNRYVMNTVLIDHLTEGSLKQVLLRTNLTICTLYFN